MESRNFFKLTLFIFISFLYLSSNLLNSLEANKHLKLSDLNNIILDTINNKFNALKFWVIADITNHSFKADKNFHYFDLVEKDPSSNNLIAKISGKAFGNGSLNISYFEKHTGQKFTNNINALLRVSVEYHQVYGLSVNVIDIDANFTLGLLQQQFMLTY